MEIPSSEKSAQKSGKYPEPEFILRQMRSLSCNTDSYQRSQCRSQLDKLSSKRQRLSPFWVMNFICKNPILKFCRSADGEIRLWKLSRKRTEWNIRDAHKGDNGGVLWVN